MSRRWGWSFAAVMLIAVFATGTWFREAVVLQAPLLPMTFGHADHHRVECTTCHHNFIDASGAGVCIDCHKQTPELAPLIEAQFHTLCRDCHAQLAQKGEPSGPLRACKNCHLPDNMP